MSRTKKLRKECIRQGLQPGPELKAVMQRLTYRMRYDNGLDQEAAAYTVLREARLNSAHNRNVDMWEAFPYHTMLHVPDSRTVLWCNDYPRRLAMKLLPRSGNRTIGDRIDAKEFGSSEIIRKPNRYEDAPELVCGWTRVILAWCYHRVVSNSLFVYVDAPEKPVTGLLKAPRGWRWEWRFRSSAVDPCIDDPTVFGYGYCLVSNSTPKKRAGITAGVILQHRTPRAIVAELRRIATCNYELRREAERRERQVRESENKQRRRTRTLITVSVTVRNAGQLVTIEFQKPRGCVWVQRAGQDPYSLYVGEGWTG